MNINKNFLLSLILNLVLTVISSNLFGEIWASRVSEDCPKRLFTKVVSGYLFLHKESKTLVLLQLSWSY